jgi:hypothetical protein
VSIIFFTTLSNEHTTRHQAIPNSPQQHFQHPEIIGNWHGADVRRPQYGSPTFGFCHAEKPIFPD